MVTAKEIIEYLEISRQKDLENRSLIVSISTFRTSVRCSYCGRQVKEYNPKVDLKEYLKLPKKFWFLCDCEEKYGCPKLLLKGGRNSSND